MCITKSAFFLNASNYFMSSPTADFNILLFCSFFDSISSKRVWPSISWVFSYVRFSQICYLLQLLHVFHCCSVYVIKPYSILLKCCPPTSLNFYSLWSNISISISWKNDKNNSSTSENLGFTIYTNRYVHKKVTFSVFNKTVVNTVELNIMYMS